MDDFDREIIEDLQRGDSTELREMFRTAGEHVDHGERLNSPALDGWRRMLGRYYESMLRTAKIALRRLGCTRIEPNAVVFDASTTVAVKIAEDAKEVYDLRGLLHATVLFKIGEHIRRLRRQQEREGPLFVEPEGIPEHPAILQEERIRCTQALAILSPEEWQVVVLRDMFDMGFAKIAEDLTVPLGTVYGRYRRAQHELRKYLGDDPESPMPVVA